MTINISDIQLFTLLKAKIGEEEATAVIDYVKQETVATSTRASDYLSKDISILKDHIDEKFKTQEQATAYKIETSKNDLIKWTFGFFITLAIMIIGIYIKK